MLNIMSYSLIIVLLIPLALVLLLSATYFLSYDSNKMERFISRFVRSSFSIMFFFASISMISWISLGTPIGSLEIASIKVNYNYSIDLRIFYDSYTIFFLWTQVFITNLISFYSHRYLHRDPYYCRFFVIISLFAFGMTIIILAGTMDLIFAGWEIIGLSSFLLIAYFWHRPKAVAAATRAYYIYRFCDLGLLAALLNAHFFWHHASLFSDLSLAGHNSIWSHIPSNWRWLISMSILLPVLGKSAQIPFCFWLPKAMEGPTHSSAIFYGSLSIHTGVYLLIRTMPIWHYTPGFNYLLASIGLLTALSATLCAHVQSNIKGQIGYASIAQVGIMLIELSLGLVKLAFFHMLGNAFLRCFQLLVSGSILTTHLHMATSLKTYQKITKFSLIRCFPPKLHSLLYTFGINDAYFEYFLITYLIDPIMFISRAISNRLTKLINSFDPYKNNINNKTDSGLIISSLPLITIFLLLTFGVIKNDLLLTINLLTLLLSLVFALGSLGATKKPLVGLGFAILSSLSAYLSISNESSGGLYVIGLFTSSLIALDALFFMLKRSKLKDLNQHSGAFGQFPAAANLFLIGILGIIAFPLSATHFGEDLILSIALKNGWPYLFSLLAVFVINGISLIRLYAMTMFGSRTMITPDTELDFSRLQSLLRLSILALGNASAFLC